MGPQGPSWCPQAQERSRKDAQSDNRAGRRSRPFRRDGARGEGKKLYVAQCRQQTRLVQIIAWLRKPALWILRDCFPYWKALVWPLAMSAGRACQKALQLSPRKRTMTSPLMMRDPQTQSFSVCSRLRLPTRRRLLLAHQCCTGSLARQSRRPRRRLAPVLQPHGILSPRSPQRRPKGQ